MSLRVGYVNLYVSDFEAAVTFYRDTLGLTLVTSDEAFGYASFDAGPISFAVAKTDDSALVGRHSGIGFMVKDIDAAFDALAAKGVVFDMVPTDQPWGGRLALFRDPDGNVHYLDPGHS